MATVRVNNPNFTDDGVTPFANWTVGANVAWVPTDIYPGLHGATGAFFISGTGNTLSQANVFTDFDTGVMHRLKVNVLLATPGTKVAVMFGTNTASTITTTGVQYFTASAATNGTLTFDIRSGLTVLDYAVMADVDVIYGPYTQYVSPAYNPFYFETTSIHTAQPNFQYVFQTFTGATGTGNPVSTIRLLPRPGGSANCIFSPARVLESFVSYDLNIQNITGATNSNNNITPYTILFGEEYGALSTGVTMYSGMSVVTGYTFNGVLQYDELPYWDFTDYALTGSTSKFLTYQPRSGVYVKNTTDRGTLDFMHNIYVGSSAKGYIQRVKVYHNSGTTSTFDFSISAQTNQIVHVPSGIWNLNQSLSGTVVNINTDWKYTIEILDSSIRPISEALTYLIDTTCSRYPTTRFMFLNDLGGFDYVNFNLVSRKTFKAKRNEYKRVLDYNYVVGERGRTVIDIDASHSYMVTSNFFNNDESEWMQQMLASNEVYVVSDAGVLTPIILEQSADEILNNTHIDNKVIQYTFSYTPAFKFETKRG